MVYVEVADEQVRHLFPLQIVAGERVEGAGSAIEHDLRVLDLDEVSGRIAVAVRCRGARAEYG